jgi:Uncharacterised nucleotidyltransferase
MSAQLNRRDVGTIGDGKFAERTVSVCAQRSFVAPEAELLLACARTVIDQATAKRIRELVRGTIDWRNVIDRAEAHRVMPLLSQTLSEVCADFVPAKVLSDIRDYAGSSAYYSLHRTAELIRLLRLFEAKGISALPFKGPVLAVLAYGNLGLRDYGDLDILVRPSDVLRTQALLTAEGYHVVGTSHYSVDEPHFSPHEKDLIFDSSDGKVRVELHWRLTGKHFDFPVDLSALWGRLKEVSLAGFRVRTLAAEDMLLYLCMHGSRHGWERLLWICDLAELLRVNPVMDWEWITREARRLGNRRTLCLGLILAKNLLGSKLPAEAWRAVQVDPSVESLARHFTESLLKDSSTDRHISYWHGIHLRMRERFQDRLRLRFHYCRRYLRLVLMPNERDHAIVGVPAALPFLYYLLRPLRLIRRLVLPELKKRTRFAGREQ